MEYAPIPNAHQLAVLGRVLGEKLAFDRRIDGGLGATTDVLLMGDERVVLRRHGPWWAAAGIDVTVRERMAMEAAAGVGTAVPTVLWSEADGLFGGPAMVIEYIVGRPLLAPQDPMDWADQLAGALASLHSVTPTEEVQQVLAPSDSDHYRAENFFEHPDARRLSDAMAAIRSQHDAPELTLIHGDFWPGNTLWRDEALVAIIDWENAAYSDPAADLAYCMLDMAYLDQAAAADRLLDTYRSLTGRSLGTLAYRRLEALSRPMPDIGQWVPAWEHLGYPQMTADVARARHRQLIAEALGD